LQHTADNLTSLGNSSNYLHGFILKSGTEGVFLFFMLSGYLMGELYLKPQEKFANFDKTSFFIKRAKRILPLYLVGILGAYLVLVLADFLSKDYTNSKQAIYYLPFYLLGFPNLLVGVKSVYLGSLISLWSIGIEMQFYLIFPLLVVYCSSNWFTQRSTIFLATLVYFVFYFLRIESFTTKFYPIISTLRFDILFVGFCASLLFKKMKFPSTNFVSKNYILLISFIFLVCALIVKNILIKELGIICSFVFILYLLKFRKQETFLDIPFINYLGEISYGIYIFHPLISYPLRFLVKLTLSSDITHNFTFSITYLLILLSATVFTAHISYQYFEKPIKNLKFN
jgi:peptidoglycan/LPS O-acetylase OafA/YrhL